MARSTYWVRYRKEEDDGSYRVVRSKAGTLMGLASVLNELLERGWQVVEIGATSPRPLNAKERQVVQTLTRGRVKIR